MGGLASFGASSKDWMDFHFKVRPHTGDGLSLQCPSPSCGRTLVFKDHPQGRMGLGVFNALPASVDGSWSLMPIPHADGLPLQGPSPVDGLSLQSPSLVDGLSLQGSPPKVKSTQLHTPNFHIS